jgi:hypothetical protein
MLAASDSIAPPTGKNNKKTIIEYLTNANIEFSAQATKKELLSLIVDDVAEHIADEEPIVVEEVAPIVENKIETVDLDNIIETIVNLELKTDKEEITTFLAAIDTSLSLVLAPYISTWALLKTCSFSHLVEKTTMKTAIAFIKAMKTRFEDYDASIVGLDIMSLETMVKSMVDVAVSEKMAGMASKIPMKKSVVRPVTAPPTTVRTHRTLICFSWDSRDRDY